MKIIKLIINIYNITMILYICISKMAAWNNSYFLLDAH